MKKLLLLSLLFITVACQKKHQEEEPLICGIPPERFVIAISKEDPHALNFLNEKNERDESVYFYSLAKDKSKIPYETSLGIAKLNRNDEKEYLAIELDRTKIKSLITGNLETIYLNNKGKTDTIQVKIVRRRNKCGMQSFVEEININGEQRKADFSLHWQPVIVY